MLETVKLRTSQIGRAGEILVQYRLLRWGIESAPMTTDAGIDLVAYAPGRKQAATIQVKSNLRASPEGGKGRPILLWRLRKNSPAEMVALVNLEHDQVWLLSDDEFKAKAKQLWRETHSLYFHVDETYAPKSEGSHAKDFEAFKIENQIERLFFLK